MPAPDQALLAKIRGGDEGAVEAMLQERSVRTSRVIRLHARRAVSTATPWTPRTFSNRCSRISCANPRPASPPKRGRPSCAPTSLPPCDTRSRRNRARNAAMRVVFPRNGNPPLASRMSANRYRGSGLRREAIRSRLRMNRPVCFWTRKHRASPGKRLLRGRRQGRRLANAGQPGGCRGAHRARGQRVGLWSETCTALGKTAVRTHYSDRTKPMVCSNVSSMLSWPSGAAATGLAGKPHPRGRDAAAPSGVGGRAGVRCRADLP